MSVIEFAERRLNDPNNAYHDQSYWSAYLDGARAQKREDDAEIKKLNGIIDVFVKEDAE